LKHSARHRAIANVGAVLHAHPHPPAARGPQQPNYAFGGPGIAVDEIFKSVSTDKNEQIRYELQRKVLDGVHYVFVRHDAHIGFAGTRQI
jgi:hypothetical protein